MLEDSYHQMVLRRPDELKVTMSHFADTLLGPGLDRIICTENVLVGGLLGRVDCT